MVQIVNRFVSRILCTVLLLSFSLPQLAWGKKGYVVVVVVVVVVLLLSFDMMLNVVLLICR